MWPHAAALPLVLMTITAHKAMITCSSCAKQVLWVCLYSYTNLQWHSSDTSSLSAHVRLYQPCQVKVLVEEGRADLAIRDRWEASPLDVAYKVGHSSSTLALAKTAHPCVSCLLEQRQGLMQSVGHHLVSPLVKECCISCAVLGIAVHLLQCLARSCGLFFPALSLTSLCSCCRLVPCKCNAT